MGPTTSSRGELPVSIGLHYADVRRSGHVHPAWRYGIGAMIAGFALTEVLTYNPAGPPIYAAVVRGSPGASVAPLDFAAPPPTGPITGR